MSPDGPVHDDGHHRHGGAVRGVVDVYYILPSFIPLLYYTPVLTLLALGGGGKRAQQHGGTDDAGWRQSRSQR